MRVLGLSRWVLLARVLCGSLNCEMLSIVRPQAVCLIPVPNFREQEEPLLVEEITGLGELV